jgi:cell division septum initiation protein DivIVA
MPELRDFLDRFRPAGAPGAAARVSVPADRDRELADELTPVLALLDDTHDEYARILALAEDEAGHITAAARTRAAVIMTDADERANAARDAAARELVEAARVQAELAVASAGQEAARISGLADSRIPALAERAIRQITRLGLP